MWCHEPLANKGFVFFFSSLDPFDFFLDQLEGLQVGAFKKFLPPFPFRAKVK